MKIEKIGRVKVENEEFVLSGFVFDAEGGNIDFDEMTRLLNDLIRRGAHHSGCSIV